MSIRFSPSMLIMTASIFLVCVILMRTSAAALEYPSPPPVPKKFDSPEDVQRYLNQLHNYYMVVGRPRFGKRSGADFLENSINSLLKKNQANGEQNENRPETEVDESITQYDFDGVGNNDRLLKAKVFKYLIRED